MRRHTGVRLLTAVTAASVLALAGCAAGGGVENATGTVIGPSPAATPTAEPDPPAAESSDGSSAETGAGDVDGACGPDEVDAIGEVTDYEGGGSLWPILYNTTSTDCAVTQPPIVELLGPDGASLPAVTEPGAMAPGRTPVDVIPADFGVTLALMWRNVPAPGADPAVDCVQASAVRIRLTADAPPIELPADVTACDGGTIVVTPYDINAG